MRAEQIVFAAMIFLIWIIAIIVPTAIYTSSGQSDEKTVILLAIYIVATAIGCSICIWRILKGK